MFDNTLIEIKCRGLDIRRQIFEAINILQPAASEDALMCKQEVVLDRSTKILTACLHKPFFLRGAHTGDGVGGEALKGLTARTNGVQQELAAKRIKPTTYKVQFRVANAIHGRRCQ